MSNEVCSIIGWSRASSGGKSFTALNPESGIPLPSRFACATGRDVERAAELASAAFSVFCLWNAARRASFMSRIAELLEGNAANIVKNAHLETALQLPRLQGELARTCHQLRFYGQASAGGLGLGARVEHGDPQRTPVPKPDLRSVMRPIGPVAVFGSSNFPLAYSVAGGDTASAFAAGCTVVFKAHPLHPGTSELVGTLIQQAARDAGAPEGTFSLIFDDGHEVGAALVDHPLIRAVGFTGSRKGGRALMDRAAARLEPIPVFAEMGSINPVFLLPGALHRDAGGIAAGLHSSVTLGVGQFCTNPGLVFVEAGSDADSFLQDLQRLMAGTPGGTMLGAGIFSSYRSGVEKLSGLKGVRLAAASQLKGGHEETTAGAALFVTDATTFQGSSALMEEVFGPSTLVVTCRSREELLSAARHLEGQLTATVHGTEADLAANRDLVEILETKAGRLICNGFPTGVEVSHAMVHGGPFPTTSDVRSTSVGTRAVERFLRPVCYQNFPDSLLPDELKEGNPLGIPRLVDGRLAV
jgi:2,5-dioxopentanoate dehydrogenase